MVAVSTLERMMSRRLLSFSLTYGIASEDCRSGTRTYRSRTQLFAREKELLLPPKLCCEKAPTIAKDRSRLGCICLLAGVLREDGRRKCGGGARVLV